jgi:hypothetical protein
MITQELALQGDFAGTEGRLVSINWSSDKAEFHLAREFIVTTTATWINEDPREKVLEHRPVEKSVHVAGASEGVRVS